MSQIIAFSPPPELPTTPSDHAPTALELFKTFPLTTPIPAGLSGEDLNHVVPSLTEFSLLELPAILVASEEIAKTSALEVAPGKSVNV